MQCHPYLVSFLFIPSLYPFLNSKNFLFSSNIIAFDSIILGVMNQCIYLAFLENGVQTIKVSLYVSVHVHTMYIHTYVPM